MSRARLEMVTGTGSFLPRNFSRASIAATII
jgi:hypothetical protein